MAPSGPLSPPDPSAAVPPNPTSPLSTTGPTPPEGIAARLLELGEELRKEGVAVGTSELLDAFAVLREIEWTAQQDFREALAATLAKSQDDRRVFELVFERFFFRAVELAAVREGVREDSEARQLRDGDEASWISKSSRRCSSTRCAARSRPPCATATTA